MGDELSELTGKFKEVLASVLPITFIVWYFIQFSPVGDLSMLYAFLIGCSGLIGLTIFLFGISQGIEPIGHDVGNAITHINIYSVVITIIPDTWVFISYAEPDLHILAKQVASVTSGQFDNILMVVVVSIGIGVMMTLGMLRILKTSR